MRGCLSSSHLQTYFIRKTWIICITTSEKFTEQLCFPQHCSLVSDEIQRTVTPFWHGDSFDYFCRGEELSSEVKSSGKMTALFFPPSTLFWWRADKRPLGHGKNGIETVSRNKGMAEVQVQKPLSSSSSPLLQDRTQQLWRQSFELTKGST